MKTFFKICNLLKGVSYLQYILHRKQSARTLDVTIPSTPIWNTYFIQKQQSNGNGIF